MSTIEKPFVGEFREPLEAFVEHKRTLGYKVTAQVKLFFADRASINK